MGALVVIPAHAAVQTTVYVSPSGNDANSGTSASKPVPTLSHARDLVRSMNTSMTGDNRTSRNTLSDNHFTNLPVEFHGGVAAAIGNNLIFDHMLVLNDGNYWMTVPPETTGGGVTISNNHAITDPAQIPSSVTGNAGLESAYRSILTWQPAI